MSATPRADKIGEPGAGSWSLDLTGLPAPVVDELRRLVVALRNNFAPSPHAPLMSESADRWAQRLQAWVDAHAARAVNIDDRRDSLYAGRGE